MAPELLSLGGMLKRLALRLLDLIDTLPLGPLGPSGRLTPVPVRRARGPFLRQA
jgi:hypothetical protein